MAVDTRWRDSGHPALYTTISGSVVAGGVFRLRPMEDREHTISVSRTASRGLAPTSVKGVRPGRDLALVLLKTIVLEGSVSGPDGNAVSGLQVSLHESSGARSLTSARTDDNGAFALRAWSGEFQLRIRRYGVVVHETAIVANGQRLDIRLPR